MRNNFAAKVVTFAALIGGLSVMMAATPKAQAELRGSKHESLTREQQQGGTEKGRAGERDTQDQEQLAREAKITMEEARTIALKRASGTVEGSELEREHGKLVYSFDIRNAKGNITEVQVNAITGKIARVEHENAKQEAKEKREEAIEQKSKTRQR